MKKKQNEIRNKVKNHCKICDKIILGSSYKFRSHLYQHQAVTSRFKCNECSKEFFRSDAYKKHMTTHTGIHLKHHICDHCDRNFVDKRNLINHLKIHDDNHCPDIYKCSACGVTYCEERLLKYHIRKEHLNLQEYHAKHVKKQCNDKWLESVNRSGVIVEIKKINDNVLTIKRHGTVKTELESVEDSVLGSNDLSTKTVKQTAFNKYINSFIACEDKSQYSKAVCHYCNKEMLKKSLKMHIKERHLKLKQFKCNVCGHAFSRHYILVNHICKKFKHRKRTIDKQVSGQVNVS